MIELKSCYKNINNKLIKKYYINNKEVLKNELLKTIKKIVRINNKLYYKELVKNKIDYKKTYYNYNGYIMNYKQVKNDILNNGLVYTFKIAIDD